MTTVLCQLGERITSEVAAAFPDVTVRSIGSGAALEHDAAGEVLLTSHYFAADLPALLDPIADDEADGVAYHQPNSRSKDIAYGQHDRITNR